MALIINELDDETGEYKQIGRVVDGNVSHQRLLELYPQRVWEKKSEVWFVPRIDGPRVFASKVDDESVDPIDDPVTEERVAEKYGKTSVIDEAVVENLKMDFEDG